MTRALTYVTLPTVSLFAAGYPMGGVLSDLCGKPVPLSMLAALSAVASGACVFHGARKHIRSCALPVFFFERIFAMEYLLFFSVRSRLMGTGAKLSVFVDLPQRECEDY